MLTTAEVLCHGFTHTPTAVEHPPALRSIKRTNAVDKASRLLTETKFGTKSWRYSPPPPPSSLTGFLLELRSIGVSMFASLQRYNEPSDNSCHHGGFVGTIGTEPEASHMLPFLLQSRHQRVFRLGDCFDLALQPSSRRTVALAHRGEVHEGGGCMCGKGASDLNIKDRSCHPCCRISQFLVR